MAFAVLRQTSYVDFRITVRNQNALIANFHHLEADAKAELVDRVEYWAEQIQEMAVEMAPYGKDTDPAPHPGFLKRNIKIKYSPSHLAFEVGCWAEDFDAIGENLYAIFQEYGTSEHGAQPFLNPSYEWGAPLMTEDVKLTIRRLAREYGARGSG